MEGEREREGKRDRGCMTGEKLKSLGELFASFDLIFFHPFPLSLEKKLLQRKEKEKDRNKREARLSQLLTSAIAGRGREGSLG